MSPLVCCVQQMRWCGSPLNPRDRAKALTVTTEMMFKCKSDIIRLNVRPSIIHEADRLCVSWRVCYAVGEEFNNTSRSFQESVVDCMRKMANAWITLYPRCAQPMLPTDVRYILEGVKWIKDFISG
ncbi:uncharacterized protein LOC144146576 [Haemaphysalis longicornis]